MSKFRILCEVSGGVTGYRTAYLKENGGKIVIFESQEKADIHRDQLASNAKAKAQYATATYRYTVEPYLTGAELLATHRYTGQEALDLD